MLPSIEDGAILRIKGRKGVQSNEVEQNNVSQAKSSIIQANRESVAATLWRVVSILVGGLDQVHTTLIVIHHRN